MKNRAFGHWYQADEQMQSDFEGNGIDDGK